MALILEFDDTNAYLSYICVFFLGLGPGFVFLGILSHLQYPQTRWNARDTCELMSFLPPKNALFSSICEALRMDGKSAKPSYTKLVISWQWTNGSTVGRNPANYLGCIYETL